MRRLLLLICIGLSSCGTQPDASLSLKDIKFPDVEFSRFIAENGIRRTEQNDSSRHHFQASKIYDSLGHLTEHAIGGLFTNHSELKYDSNGLVTETIESGCVVQRHVSKFQRIKTNMVREDNYQLRRIEGNTADTPLMRSSTVYLLDKNNRVALTAQYFPGFEARLNNLFVQSFRYDSVGKLLFTQKWHAALPLLPLRKSEGAIYMNTRYYYMGNKPDSVVISRLFTKRSFSLPIAVKEINIYDERGLIKKTIIDDTLIIGYQHYTDPGDSLSKRYQSAVRVL